VQASATCANTAPHSSDNRGKAGRRRRLYLEAFFACFAARFRRRRKRRRRGSLGVLLPLKIFHFVDMPISLSQETSEADTVEFWSESEVTGLDQVPADRRRLKM